MINTKGFAQAYQQVNKTNICAYEDTAFRQNMRLIVILGNMAQSSNFNYDESRNKTDDGYIGRLVGLFSVSQSEIVPASKYMHSLKIA